MKTRTLISLLAITAVVVIGAAWAVVTREAAVERTVVEETVFPGLIEKVNEIQAIEVTNDESTFAVRHDGERWVVSAMADFPAEFEDVKKTLLGLAELSTLEAKTANPERHGALGLAEPGSGDGSGLKVRLLDEGDQSLAALVVGDPGRGGDDLVYVRRDGEDQTWIAGGAVDIAGEPKDWIDTLLMKLDMERIRRVTIRHADGETVALYKDTPEDSEFILADLPEDASLKSPLSLDTVARAVSVVRFDEVAAPGKVPADSEPATVATYESFDGAKVVLSLFSQGDEIWTRIDASYDPAAAVAPAPAIDAAADIELPEEFGLVEPENEEGEGAEDEAVPERIDVAAETEQVVARTGRWLFKLPDFKNEQFGTRLEKLIELPVPEGGEEADGAEPEFPITVIPGPSE